MSSSTAAERFYTIVELLALTCAHLDPHHFRVLARTSHHNYDRFNNDGWRRLDGIGNLLTILEDRLGRPARARGTHVTNIPSMTSVPAARKARFLLLCPAVEELNVYSNPDRWTIWQGWRHLLELVEGTNDVLFPALRYVTIRVNGTQKIVFNDMASVLTGPQLAAFLVQPGVMSSYTACEPADASLTLRTLRGTIARPYNGLTSLSLSPDSSAGSAGLRNLFIDELRPLLPRLSYLAISHWLLRPALIQLLSSSIIQHLVIHGRFAVDAEDLGGLANLAMPQSPFVCLRTLELKHIPLEDTARILSTPGLLSHVTALRVAAQPVTDLDAMDGAEYLTLFNLVAEAPHLVRLVIVARQDELDEPFCLSKVMIDQLTKMPLEVLRLYNFALPLPQGFGFFHPVAWPSWQCLKQLSVLRQNLTPEDLILFAGYPHLSHLSANVSAVLGRSHNQAIAKHFGCQLTLGTRFEWTGDELSATDKKRIVTRIAHIFLQTCPSGLHLDIDRRFRRGNQKDERDALWANTIIKELRQLGLTTHQFVQLT
ncbi:hypothetical protein RhiJN_10316 [Ceratobasidium sp. AG-Ba]|nr:hypothetical protein RhiJN_10316 [Ceratobasidium sp. AG-Ba]